MRDDLVVGRRKKRTAEPVVLKLFKTDYNLAAATTINRNGFVWTLTPHMFEKDGRIGIDILVKLSGIRKGHFLYTRFGFQQPGNERHDFEHVFDYNRNTFFYRRALTIPRVVGSTERGVYCHYIHSRFLRRFEDDEPLEIGIDEDDKFIPEIPLNWDYNKEIPTHTDTNAGFFKNINALEKDTCTFMYHFFIEHSRVCTIEPANHSMYWPKASVVARYLGGRVLAVDANWFLPTWPTFRKFMSNVDLILPADFEDLIDVLGHYYHGWSFEPARQVELVRAAEKFGFFDFSLALHTMGDVESFQISQKSVMMVQKTNPLNQVISKKKSTFMFEETFSINHKLIYNESSGSAPFYSMYSTKNDMTWIVNMMRRTFMGVEYLSVQCILNGRYKTGEHQLWTVDFGPAKKKLKKLKRYNHTRALNHVQRTICFPTCYAWTDVIAEMGNGPYHFQVKVSYRTLPSWVTEEVAEDRGAAGLLNADVLCKGDSSLPVNMHYIQSICQLPLNWESVPGTHHRRLKLPNLTKYEMMHFLDFAYHGSKVLTPKLWSEILKVANQIRCGRVVDGLERSMLRTEAGSLTSDKLTKYMYLKFYVDMHELLGIGTVDDYMNSREELIISW